MSVRIERFKNVWDAIEDSPEAAVEMERRSVLMIALIEHIRLQRWSKKEAAQKLDAPEEHIAMLLSADIDSLSEESLKEMCRVGGLHPS